MLDHASVKKINQGAKKLYKLYVGTGILAVALLMGCVIFAVVMRYIFNVSFTFLEEFMTTLFAFTTFWGIGICIIEDEHVVIDTFFNFIPKKIQHYLRIFNLVVVGIIDGFLFSYGFKYALKYGAQISMGMRIPMIYMYGIIPLGAGIGLVCVAVKIGQLIFVREEKSV